MPTNKKIAIQIEGMTCQTCANRIEKVLNKKPFVLQAGVNFAAEEALVEFDSSAASEQDILTIIQKAGFSGKVKTDAVEAPQKVAKVSLRLWLLLAINLVFSRHGRNVARSSRLDVTAVVAISISGDRPIRFSLAILS